MAVGDSNDMFRRIASLLPPKWWSNVAPYQQAVVGALGDGLSWVYSLIQYTKLQTRIGTATGPWLDLIAFDFFGLRFRRHANQGDDNFRQDIINEILRPRVNRYALQKAVSDLTQTKVTVFEPFNPMDTGGFGVMFAFNTVGAFGSSNLPYTVFLDVVEPPGAGIPNISGFNDPQSGFGAGMFYFADLSTIKGEVTNQDIYDTIEATRAAGVTCWVKIGPPEVTHYRIGVDFIIGQSTIG